MKHLSIVPAYIEPIEREFEGRRQPSRNPERKRAQRAKTLHRRSARSLKMAQHAA